MAAAGYGSGYKGTLDYMVREVATFKLWAQAVQAMLQQGLGLDVKLRTVVESVWFDDVKSGNFDLAVGAVVSLIGLATARTETRGRDVVVEREVR